MKDINIVYITDEKYVMPTCISILSLQTNWKTEEQKNIYIISNDISKESQKKLMELDGKDVLIKLVPVNNSNYIKISQKCLVKNTHVSSSALYKFDIADIIPDIEKVLYLDSDIIVQKDLSDMYNTDIDNYYLAAINDMGDSKIAGNKSALATRIDIYDRSYFNSGVMLLNLKKMREDSVYTKLLDYRMNGKNYFMDQDALNTILGCKRKILAYNYNFRTTIFDEKDFEDVNLEYFNHRYLSIEICIEEQSILHLTSKMKPWEYYMPWFTDIFMEYYKKSPYSKEKLNLKSPIKKTTDFYRQEIRDMIFGVPYDRLPVNSKIILYGAGKVGKDFYQQLIQNKNYEVIAWVDKKYDNEKIHSPIEIKELVYDFILIAVREECYIEEIKTNLIELGVELKKMIFIK